MAKKEVLTIIKADVSKEINAKVKPKFLKLGKMEFKTTVEVEKKMADELDTDARFVAKLYDDATKKYKELLSACCLKVQYYNDLSKMIPLTDKELKELNSDLKGLFEKYNKEIEKVVNKHFETWKKTNKARTKYRLKIAGAIVVGSASVVVSSVSLAAGAVTGGVSIAASIYGIAQSVVAIGRAVQKICQDIATVQKNLEKAVKELVSSYEKQSKAKVKAKEIGKEFVSDFLMVEMAGFNRCDKHMETYTAKLKNLELESGKLGKTLNKLLDEQAKMDKEINRKLEKIAKDRNYKSKKLDGLFDSMEKCRKASAKLIKDLEAWHIMLKPAEDFRDGCKKAIEALRHKDPVWAKWIIWIGSLGLTTGVLRSPRAARISSTQQQQSKRDSMLFRPNLSKRFSSCPS